MPDILLGGWGKNFSRPLVSETFYFSRIMLFCMDRDAAIEKTKKFVKRELSDDFPAHDWWHVYRVWRNAIRIGKDEGVDLFTVQLAALLHDIEDWKFSDEEMTGSEKARNWLDGLKVDEKTVSHVCEIIENISFKGAGVRSSMRTEEGKVVQDADRLDAIGAIGIARCFAYGGSRGRQIHDPEEKPGDHESFEDYKNSKSSSINHFHEKLLLLKERMNTESAKQIAEGRHEFMRVFLDRFHEEWEGKK